jgi:hypothetical protein
MDGCKWDNTSQTYPCDLIMMVFDYFFKKLAIFAKVMWQIAIGYKM